MNDIDGSWLVSTLCRVNVGVIEINLKSILPGCANKHQINPCGGGALNYSLIAPWADLLELSSIWHRNWGWIWFLEGYVTNTLLPPQMFSLRTLPYQPTCGKSPSELSKLQRFCLAILIFRAEQGCDVLRTLANRVDSNGIRSVGQLGKSPLTGLMHTLDGDFKLLLFFTTSVLSSLPMFDRVFEAAPYPHCEFGLIFYWVDFRGVFSPPFQQSWKFWLPLEALGVNLNF